jgi:membrane protease YdiL (CAAX protease family)
VSIEGVPRRALYWMYALAGVPLAIAIQMLSRLAQPKGPLPMEAFLQDRQSVLLLAAMGILVAPVVEETLFRGFLYPVFARGLGIPGGIVVTGTVFGLVHAPQLWGGWAQIALLILVGVIFSSVRASTKSVVPCYLLHLGYNAFLFLGFYFATGGLERLPAR